MSELRQRRVGSDPGKRPLPAVKSVVRKLDLFPKVHEDYVMQTKGGAYVSLITTSILILLLFVELVAYFRVDRNDHITVRDSHSDPMFINFNVTMYNITCGKILFDIQDDDDVHSYESSSRLVKMELNQNGSVLNLFRSNQFKGINSTCGSCYGAERDDMCCNTCEDIVSAYKLRGWDTWMLYDHISLCQKQKPNKVYQRRFGCMLWGTLDVNQVSGIIHIATRTGQVDSYNRPTYDSELLHLLSSSHYIHHFLFGDPIPGIQNPLEKRRFLSNDITSHRYYIQALPATYNNGKTKIRSNQISVYETDELVTIGMNGYADYKPGLFLEFHISPFMHVIEEKSVAFRSFLIRLCAVIGGVMTISRMLDSILYTYMK